MIEYPVRIQYDTSGSISSIEVPDLGRNFFDEIAGLHRDEEGQAPFALFWRPALQDLIKGYINEARKQRIFLNLPKEVKDYQKSRVGDDFHWELVQVDAEIERGFFEKYLRYSGMFINLVSALSTMIIQILATELTAKDQDSGRKIGVPMALAALVMNIVTYNYSDALKIWDSAGRKLDYLFFCLCLKRGANQEGAHVPKSCAIPKGIVVLLLFSFFVTWVTTTSVGTFQEGIAIGHRAEEIESFLTEDVISAIAWIQTISSGIAMVSFFVPFIFNAIHHSSEKIDQFSDYLSERDCCLFFTRRVPILSQHTRSYGSSTSLNDADSVGLALLDS